MGQWAVTVAALEQLISSSHTCQPRDLVLSTKHEFPIQQSYVFVRTLKSRQRQCMEKLQVCTLVLGARERKRHPGFGAVL